MKKLFFLILFAFVFQINYSQELLMDTEDVHPSDVIEPKFNGGGMDKFYEFINKEFDFSKVTKKGKMLVSFTINEAGALKNIRVLKVLDDFSAAEIIRVLQKSPVWESAKRGGKPFDVEIKMPFDFK